MSWFDSETDYFQAPDGPLRQGDVVLAPTAVFEPGPGQAPGVAPAGLGEERTVQVWRGARQSLPDAPALQARVRWDLAMVLPHDCSLEKEFNERVAELMAAGQAEDAAIHAASADPMLDRLIAVAPVLGYDTVLPRRREGIRTGQRLGTFPVPHSAAYAIEPSWVNLNAVTTVDRSFFSANLRVAALKDRTVDYLRAALARHWAYRDLTREDEISRAIGRHIVDIKAAPMPKERLRLELFLDGEGGTLTLEGSSKPAPPDRRARRAPR
jgi:hypothetical protein